MATLVVLLGEQASVIRSPAGPEIFPPAELSGRMGPNRPGPA